MDNRQSVIVPGTTLPDGTTSRKTKHDEERFRYPTAEMMTIICSAGVLLSFLLLTWFNVGLAADDAEATGAALGEGVTGLELLLNGNLPASYHAFMHTLPGNIQILLVIPLAALAALVMAVLSIRQPENRDFYKIGILGTGLLGMVYFFWNFQNAGYACKTSLLVYTRGYWWAFVLMGGLIVQAAVERPHKPYNVSLNLLRDKLRPANLTRDLTPGRLLLYGFLTFSALVAMIPFLWMISTSLMSNTEAQAARRMVPAVPQYCNYVTAWKEANFSRYFMNSVIISFTTIGGMLVTCILAGYAFGRIKFVGSNLAFTLVLATLMIPESVTMIPNFLIVNAQVFPLPNPMEVPPFIGFQGTWMDSLQGLTVPFMASAFSIFLLRQFFAQIPDELWEAARIDGAGHLRFLVQICLPIARPAILTVTLLTFIGAWNSFLWPIIITREDTWRPIVLGLYTFTQEAGTEIHLLMAASFITIIPMLVLYFLTQKSFTEGIATTGLKG
jgi:ABC-type glycerol-3-phosphate transport system permease component